MKVVTTYTGVPYQVRNGARGYFIDLDAQDLAGNGTTDGLNPHEDLLGSVGACTAMTMLMYAKRQKWVIDKLTITTTEGKTDDPQKSGSKIPHISMKAEIVSETLTAEQITKLKEIGDRCPLKKLIMEAKVIDLEVTLAEK